MWVQSGLAVLRAFPFLPSSMTLQTERACLYNLPMLMLPWQLVTQGERGKQQSGVDSSDQLQDRHYQIIDMAVYNKADEAVQSG